MDEVAKWLKHLGLGEYAPLFAENDIDEALLPSLTDTDLKEIGIASLGHRRRLLQAIAARADNTSPPVVPVQAPVAPAERRQLTVMFCDLVGSTALSARLDPEDLRALVARYHASCSEVISRHGGRVAQYLGDGIMAYFGYPQAHEYDAERAVRAALDTLADVRSLDVSEPLQVRIGIATGLVVTGEIGVGDAQLRGALGETPNLAARMQALADPDSVVIDAQTRRLLGELFEYRSFGPVTIKGFAAPLDAFTVLRPSTHQSRFEALHGLRLTPLVGRDDEIELMLRRWRHAKSREGQVVLLSGEPGIGKSRLVAAFLDRVASEPHLQLRYFCSPHHQDSALYPVIAQIEHASGLKHEDAGEEKLSKLEAVLAQAGPTYSEHVPLIAGLLSIPLGNRYALPDFSPQSRRERLFQAFASQIEGLSARQPVLFLFEDLHWADPTTRDLLDLLVERIAGLPVLMLLTFRPEYQPPWIGQSHVTLLTLNRLSPRHRAEFIERVAGGKSFPKDLADQIAARTDGVPLFLEELTKSVLESGVVVATGQTYAMANTSAPLAIPATLQASLLARLDRLAPVREVAQIGAVLGRTFSHALIAAATGLAPVQLEDALNQLVSAELIYRRGTSPDAEYTFKHALVQDAAYESLLKARRHQLHARIATVLESDFPDIAASEPERLAHHFKEAGNVERSVAYWLRAGAQAVSRSGMREAVAHLQQGLKVVELLPEGEDRWRSEVALYNALGQAQIATKGFASPEARAAFIRARQLCEKVANPPQLVAIRNGEVFVHLAGGDIRGAQQLSKEFQELGHSRNDRFMEAIGYQSRGRAAFFAGEFEAARSFTEAALRLYDPEHRRLLGALAAEDPHVVMRGFLAYALMALGNIEDARRLQDDMLANARRPGQGFTLAYALTMACANDWLSGDLDRLLAHSEELASHSERGGYPLFHAFGMMYWGWSRLELGQGSEEMFERGCAMAEAVAGPLWAAYTRMMRASRSLAEGRTDRTLEQLDEAERSIVRTNVRFFESELHRIRGCAEAREGRRERAEVALTEAVTIARSQNSKLWELRAALSMAEFWRETGKREKAFDLLTPVTVWFPPGLDLKPLTRARTLLTDLS